MRLTEKNEIVIGGYRAKMSPNGMESQASILSKLGRLEDLEDELGIDLITLFKAARNGFYYKKDNEIQFCRWCVRVGGSLVEVKPCYAVKETTLRSTYYGDVEEVTPVEDAHYWSWRSCVSVKIKDYGKIWALTKEELL